MIRRYKTIDEMRVENSDSLWNMMSIADEADTAAMTLGTVSDIWATAAVLWADVVVMCMRERARKNCSYPTEEWAEQALEKVKESRIKAINIVYGPYPATPSWKAEEQAGGWRAPCRDFICGPFLTRSNPCEMSDQALKKAEKALVALRAIKDALTNS